MRALVCESYGEPETLVVANVADPEPGVGQVLINVCAAGVNFPDVLSIAGKYQVREPLPFIPGSEFAGEVAAVGADVDVKVGQRVYGVTPTGAFAEQVVVDADTIEPIPDGVDFAVAAGFTVVYRTAHSALRTIARVQRDDWVVVLGAAGGVGLAAVDVAASMGARVVAAASTAEKLQLCRDRGAVAAVNYERDDLRSQLREITGSGAQAVIDPVGGRYAEPALRSLRPGGVFVTLGFAAGSIPQIPLNLVLLKGITVRGMELRTFASNYPEDAKRNEAELEAMLAQARVRPYVGARFGFEDAAAALRTVAERKALGKVVIEVR